ncbi:MAG TPA: helix-turn-helix transcriptional regulator [Gammaproteobacteria bacterium]|nr:helix-turn-helix transcriptional regulator [Gammaproteobacteria bacterium]
MGKELGDLKKERLQDPEVAANYAEQAPEYALARELIAARKRAGMTQAEVADRMHTNQPTVARLESGRQTPTWKTLRRYAEATGSQTEVRLVPTDDSPRGSESTEAGK